jgi:cysteine synthase A
MKHQDILGTIGRTPVVRLNRLAPPGVNLYVKVEAFNPMGSVKDRLALGIIEAAEQSGQLHAGQTVVEATSGNTGIGLAMVCAAKGYPLVVTMAENFSVERRRLMRFLGARVVLTPAALKGSGMLAKAAELAREHGWFFVRQFENEANAEIHSRTTAPEILADFADERLDAWVTGFGSGGTLKGVARVLREHRPETRIVVCEPDNSPLLGSGSRQPRLDDGAPAGSHPAFRPHVMQGWSPDFIPKLVEEAVDASLIDEVFPVNGAEAMRLARDLARQEGILAGISSGATLAGALAVGRRLGPGANILCMLPDTGERYLSTPLFADIAADMDDAEIDLSRSTASARFDSVAPPPGPAVAAIVATTPAAISREASDFVEQSIVEHPVLMFALEWCEFCWSVRRMFKHLGIDYRSIDLDSVAFQEGGRGDRIRAALSARTGMQTIPQIFVAGKFMGGCTDFFQAWNGGQVRQLLDANAIGYTKDLRVDTASFLPGWLQAR